VLLLNCVANSIFIHALLCLVLQCSNAPMLQWSCATMLIWLHCCSVVLLISYASTRLCSCAAISLLQCCCAAMQCCYTPQSSRWCALLTQKLFTCVMNCLATVLCCVVLQFWTLLLRVFDMSAWVCTAWLHGCALYCCMMSHNSFCSNETILTTASQLAHDDGTVSSLQPVSALRDIDLLPSFSVHHITPTVLEMTYTDFI